MTEDQDITGTDQGSASSRAASPAPRPKKSRPIEMRTVHRAVAFIAVLFTLYVGVTGTLMQSIDLVTLISGAPETNRTMQSINEGKFGNRPYSVMSVADWSEASLPTGYGIDNAFATTLSAFHRTVPGIAPQFIELRVAHGKVIGQAGYLDPSKPPPKPGRPRAQDPDPIELKAFDAATGQPVAPVKLRNAVPAHSLRQSLKQWHRFWGPDTISPRDTPGVYIESLVGLMMSTLIVTGLVIYFRLLRQRRKVGRGQLFWMAGNVWRSLHRITSVAAAILLVCVAASGTWLGFESSYHTFTGRPKPAVIGRLTDDQAIRIARATATIIARANPAFPVRVIRVRNYAGMDQGVVITGGSFTRQLIYDAKTGRETNLSEPNYPSSGFPLGMDVHEWVKHFHSGYLFGLPARFLDLFAGLSLIFLSVSGITMYVEMYGKRRKSGRTALFWR